MSCTSMPKCCATTACPNSCRSTTANSSRVSKAPYRAPYSVPEPHIKAPQATAKANVACILMSMPRTVATRHEHFIRKASQRQPPSGNGSLRLYISV